MMKEPESKTSSSFTQLAAYLMGQPLRIDNKGFVSRFVDSILEVSRLNLGDIKV